ncbi:MAG: methyl-accepting chemotaxis protein [Thermodesulfobacteriota bacterium]|nr:methyl-accepting chemotaxis protein [Thermodesulfobacteriota bacterium]
MDEKRDLTKELDECQRHLTQLCADIEPEFLQLGRGLESIFQRAQDLSEQARGAVYLHATAHLREEGQTSASGGHLRKVTDLFLDVRDIFNTSLDALRTTIEESAKAVRHIFNIGKELESLKSGHNALERLAVITRILGISTRIECGRLGDMGSGFIFLSDQISNFSGALSKYASDFETEVKQVLANIEEAETSVAARLKIQSKESDRISQQIMGALDIVDMASAQMTRLSEQIDHFSERVLREVGEIVSALQFQDITRQQVEHVQAALAEPGNSLNGKILKKCSSKELSVVYGNLAVQLSQLRNVRSEITAAGQNIMTALEGIGREIEGHVRHVAEAIGETSGGEGDNALAMLEPQMEALGQQLKNSFLLSEILFKTISNVSGLVERIGSNQTKINKTRLDMKILALNAQVQAARLGGDGRALSVLAEDMQHLSDSWSAVAEETASLLQSAVNVAADLKDKLEGVLEHCRSQTAKSQERASNAVLLLQTASDKTGSAVEAINQASHLLGEDVAALVNTIKFPQIAEAGLERVISHLEHLQDEIGKRLSPEEKRLITVTPVLDTTAERYTMESERRMHTHALQQFKPGADAPGRTDARTVELLEKDTQIKAIGTDDMGDNVELF